MSTMKTPSTTLVAAMPLTVATWCIASIAGNLCTIQVTTTNYVYLQVGATSSLMGPDQLLTFTVRTCNDATLLLSANTTDLSHNIFEIVVGGWANTLSVIRNAMQGSPLVSTSHSPLSCTDTRAFYVRWDLYMLRVGNLTGQPGAWSPASPFLTWNITPTQKINYLFVASWNKPGNWTFDNCSSLTTATYSSGQTVSGSTPDITTCCSDQVTNVTTAELTSTSATTPPTTTSAETTTSTKSSAMSTTATTPITSTTTTALDTAVENTAATSTTPSESQVSTDDSNNVGATTDGTASTMSPAAWSSMPDTKQCACACRKVSVVNVSSVVLEERIRHLVVDLKIQPKNTFAYSQRLNSAHDSRVSSGAIGVVGIVCIVLPFGLILCFDLADLFRKSSRCRK